MAQVLLIEPDKILARSYVSGLEADGHIVHWCQKSETAIHAMDEHTIDLIIVELQLAEHNGVEFLHELRSYPEWDHIPVLLHSMLPKKQSGIDTFWHHFGIVGHLYKPQTTLAYLNQTVNRALLTTA